MTCGFESWTRYSVSIHLHQPPRQWFRRDSHLVGIGDGSLIWGGPAAWMWDGRGIKHTREQHPITRGMTLGSGGSGARRPGAAIGSSSNVKWAFRSMNFEFCRITSSTEVACVYTADVRIFIIATEKAGGISNTAHQYSTKNLYEYSKTSLTDHLHRSTTSLHRSHYLRHNRSPTAIF